MKERVYEIDLTNGLKLKESFCNGVERHKVVFEQVVGAEATIIAYETIQDFLNLFWQPVIIAAECDWLSSQVLDEVSFNDLIQWDEKTLLKNIGEDEYMMDEAGLLISALQFKESIQQYSQLKGLEIESISAINEGKGFGTRLVNHYKDTVDYIVLYSTSEATEYWEKQGFMEFNNGYYVWSKRSDVLKLFVKQWSNVDNF